VQEISGLTAYEFIITHDGGIRALVSDIPVYTAGDNISIAGHVISATSARGSSATVALSTAALADSATETGTTPLGKRFDLLSAQADRPCRLRLYSTAAARTADASRPAGTRPDAGAGLICDLVFIIGGLSIDLSPIAAGANLDSLRTDAIYYAVQNLSGSTAATTLSLLILTLE
jgi:hypothetical protein